MADKAISDLTAASSVGALDLFVLEQNNTAKKLAGQTLLTYLGSLWQSYGGITDITQYYAVSDSDSVAPSTWYTTMQSMTATDRYLWSYMTITYATTETQDTTPVIIGVWGDKGDTWYTHIKYASNYPTQDSDMGDTPDAYVGVYTGISASAPGHYTDYDWYGWKGIQGDTGTSITGVAKTGTSGDVDTYTVSFSNGNTTTFTVTNGSNISSIAKTSTSGLVDTYTVTLTNGNTTQFTVTNAKSITSIQMASGNHSAGSTDVYQINFNDGDTASFQVYNGANGTGAVSTVAGIGVEGANGNVPLILKGNGQPTTATIGQENQIYFDQTGSNFYICLGESSGTYLWAGTSSITIDAAMSTSSENPVQNKVISTKVGTTALNTTATDLSNAINEHENDIGNMSLDTSASNLTGAINELVSDIGTINTNIGSVVLPTTAQTLTGAIAELDTDLGGKAATDASNISSASAWLTALGTKASDYTIYDSVADLGLTSGEALISGTFSTMVNHSILICDATEFSSNQRPTANCTIEIVKQSATHGYINAYGQQDGGGDWRMYLNSSGVPTGTWYRVVNDSYASSTTMTITRKSTAASLTKWGKLVMFASPNDFTSIPSGTATIGTVPSGYRPAARVYGQILNANSFQYYYIDANGTITMYSQTAFSSAANGAMQAVWITP